MNLDDTYGTDPVADDLIPKGTPHMMTPCYVCQRPVDTTAEHVRTHPWGMAKPVRVMCSDACFVDYWQTEQRERNRVAS